jgi:hypothetical protein
MSGGYVRTRLSPAKNASGLLDMYFLNMRSALLETAAALDRIERASESPEVLADLRLAKIREACGILAGEEKHRAERLLILFSEPR